MEIESAVGAPSTNDHTGSHRNYKNAIYDDDDDSEASGGGDGGGGGGYGGLTVAYLVWEELTVVLPGFGNKPTKRILQGLNGYAEPGRIMAIMGPSGSGKSTLLDSLAGFSSFPLFLIFFIQVKIENR